jgi:asparagine synthase (glutamine-hydrolysing)
LRYASGSLWHGRGWQDGPSEVVLIHQRLSILDLSPAGWQPMTTGDRRYYIIFNGEIYNYIELRQELETAGHQFVSRSDTEVLLAAYVRWGKGMLERLVGMFALAILDTKERRLLLARDCFGIKPLYYTHFRDGLAFASELRPLLELPGVSRRVNPQRLFEYLRFGVTDHGEETLLEQSYQVAAAHLVEVDVDRPSVLQRHRYWRTDSSRRIELSEKDAADSLRERFIDSVRLHLRSDVPIGTALSGGIDSAAIACTMRYLDPDLELHAFSYVAEDAKLNEERWVDRVGSSANVTLHKVCLKADDIVSELDRLIDVQQEPFASTSIYAQYRVFQQARESGIKVMLDGQGADEMLGGYLFSGGARLATLLAAGDLPGALRFFRKARGRPGNERLLMWAGEILTPDWLQGPARRFLDEDLMPRWFNADWFAERGIVARPARSVQGRDKLRGLLERMLTEGSLPMLLRYEDRNSMAHSLESRVPFLTRELAEFVLALPEHYLVSNDGTTKAIFRQAMRGIVPDEILDRRDKIGFATPEQQWLKRLAPWVERVLSSATSRSLGVFDQEGLLAQWRTVAEGRARFSGRIWRALNFVTWAQRFDVVLH